MRKNNLFVLYLTFNKLLFPILIKKNKREKYWIPSSLHKHSCLKLGLADERKGQMIV